ncbi:unknown protein [Simkania negevensis Z]|uniref:Uncharacterized protein n=1 Tax=Simkania negevensis (strain ATCC VR-1471 / DSM 27360 / Z) TaxID=331113 RepID=F8L9P4_SIMNZ|nr:unknown protein [Simkania negevensis Z]
MKHSKACPSFSLFRFYPLPFFYIYFLRDQKLTLRQESSPSVSLGELKKLSSFFYVY